MFPYPSVYNTSFVRSVAAAVQNVFRDDLSCTLLSLCSLPQLHITGAIFHPETRLHRWNFADLSGKPLIKAFSVSLRGEEPLSVLLIVTKAGNDWGKLPLKVKEEDKKEATASVAAAEETDMKWKLDGIFTFKK